MWPRDWSSDVCSSDLLDPAGANRSEQHLAQAREGLPAGVGGPVGHFPGCPAPTVARESSVAKCSAFCIADGPSACALIRTTRSSLIEVPVKIGRAHV